MDKEKAIAALTEMPANGDAEHDHCVADDILVRVLRGNGLADVADAYEAARERVGFWYA